MIGSMSPDFGYFFSHEFPRSLTHSLPGLFIFCLPAGFLIWLFYVAILEKATITLLSDRWHTRFAHTDAITPSLIARAAVAIVLGAITHLIWDNFTHRNTLMTNAIPVLQGPTPGFSWLPIYHVLHFLSTIVGLLILGYWLRHLHRQPARSLIRPYKISERARVGALWLILAVSLIVGFVQWLPYSARRYDTQMFVLAVGSMSGLFVAWCCVALTLWFRARKARGVR